MDDRTDDGTDDGMDGWKASFRPRRPLIYKIARPQCDTPPCFDFVK